MYPHHRNAIPRHNSFNNNNNNNNMKTPSNLAMISSSSSEEVVQPFMDLSLPLVGHATSSTTAKPFKFFLNPFSSIASMFRSLQSLLIPTCRFLATAPASTPSRASRRHRRRLMTGTFFGRKKGRVSFAVQETPRSDPILLLELATPTAHLVREMASGTVRILLECERNNNNNNNNHGGNGVALLDEPMWTMYCNGRRLGYAASRRRRRPYCAPSDLRVLSVVEAVSAGAGVMPTMALAPPAPGPTEVVGKSSDHGGHDQVMYMRAKFERVTGSSDSEAFYMVDPDCGGGRGGKRSDGGPELSIFLLRI